MALIFSGAGGAGARSIRAAVDRLEASDELRDDPHLLVWAAFGPLWLREAKAGRSLYERALALVRRRTALGALPELLVHVARDWATTDDSFIAFMASGQAGDYHVNATGERSPGHVREIKRRNVGR